MTDAELLDLINSLSSYKITKIVSIDSVTKPNASIVIGEQVSLNQVEFTLTTEGDFSEKYLGLSRKFQALKAQALG